MKNDILKNRPLTTKGLMHLSVGQKAGDLQGNTDRVLQAGVAYLAQFGGGVLHIGPGVYDMDNALYVPSNVHLIGAGEETVLKKTPSFCSELIWDADWYEARVRVKDVRGFVVGGGIMLRSYQNERLSNVVQATITDIEGDVIALDKRLLKNFWVGDRATAATLFPLITAKTGTSDVCVENLVLDGNWPDNEEINGNYSGAMFIQECDRFSFRHVVARNYHGDGFSFQVCDDIHFESCRAVNNESRGFHPGSGSQRPVFDRCIAEGNDQGIFFCWGVSDGQVTHCDCSNNRRFGISIGHRDTDNHILNTTIERNEQVGVFFREPNTDFRGGHRNVISECKIADNGSSEAGFGVDIRGFTSDITLSKNTFSNSGAGIQTVGIRVGAEAQNIVLDENVFQATPQEIVDLRTDQ